MQTSSQGDGRGQSIPDDVAMKTELETNFPDECHESANRRSDGSDIAAGRGSSRSIFIELCAGSAALSAAVKARGYDVVAVDHSMNRHKTKCKVLNIDLSTDHAVKTILALIDNFNILCVHIGPPCGTCSKARGIPMPDGSPGPQPLRSDDKLLGVDGLNPLDQFKVDSANRLYEKISIIVEKVGGKTDSLDHRESDEFLFVGPAVLCIRKSAWLHVSLPCMRIWQHKEKAYKFSLQ